MGLVIQCLSCGVVRLVLERLNVIPKERLLHDELDDTHHAGGEFITIRVTLWLLGVGNRSLVVVEHVQKLARVMYA